MQNEHYSVDINTSQVKANTISKIESLAIEYDGIIFGGAVRDQIISQHYATRFNKYLKANKQRFNSKEFWDVNVHPETAPRTLVADDVDIYFRGAPPSYAFIAALNLLCEKENIHVEKKPSNKENDISKLPPKYGKMLNVETITLTMKVGRIPFLFSGYGIVIDIDIVTPNYTIVMLPPFNNLDFLCNGFIKTNYGIMYSTDTNTYVDTLSTVDRNTEILKIQKDMIEFKTYFCKFEKLKQNQMSTYAKNTHAFRRISKLLKKQIFPWTIQNLPFDVKEYTEEDNIETDCCICISKLETGNIVAITSSQEENKHQQACVMHKKCMMEYLRKQSEDAAMDKIEDNERFIFKCPYRCPIDFTAIRI